MDKMEGNSREVMWEWVLGGESGMATCISKGKAGKLAGGAVGILATLHQDAQEALLLECRVEVGRMTAQIACQVACPAERWCYLKLLGSDPSPSNPVLSVTIPILAFHSQPACCLEVSRVRHKIIDYKSACISTGCNHLAVEMHACLQSHSCGNGMTHGLSSTSTSVAATLPKVSELRFPASPLT